MDWVKSESKVFSQDTIVFCHMTPHIRLARCRVRGRKLFGRAGYFDTFIHFGQFIGRQVIVLLSLLWRVEESRAHNCCHPSWSMGMVLEKLGHWHAEMLRDCDDLDLIQKCRLNRPNRIAILRSCSWSFKYSFWSRTDSYFWPGERIISSNTCLTSKFILPSYYLYTTRFVVYRLWLTGLLKKLLLLSTTCRSFYFFTSIALSTSTSPLLLPSLYLYRSFPRITPRRSFSLHYFCPFLFRWFPASLLSRHHLIPGCLFLILPLIIGSHHYLFLLAYYVGTFYLVSLCLDWVSLLSIVLRALSLVPRSFLLPTMLLPSFGN